MALDMGTHRNFQKMLQAKMFPHGLILSFLIFRRMDVPADANAANHPPCRRRLDSIVLSSRGPSELWEWPTSLSWIGASSHQSYMD